MTMREALTGADAVIRARLEEVLDSEDAIVILVNRRGVSTFAHGYGVSGCQLEMLARELELVLRHFGENASPRATSACPQ